MIFLLILSLDLILKRKSKSLHPHAFVLIWAMVVIFFYTYAAYSGEAVYDAFILPSLPALAIIAASALMLVYKIPMNKKALTTILLIILFLGAFSQLSYANKLITNKLTSFDVIKEAGLFIKENSEKGDIVISQSHPQNTYYSERKTYPPANSTENMLKQFKETQPKYLMNSVFEPTASHVYEFPQKYPNLLIPIKVYTFNNQQATLIIYSVNISNLN